MYLEALKWLTCLRCKDSMLDYSAFKTTEAGEVEDGVLVCSCGERYPIISGVPRILPPALRHLLQEDYGWFFKQYATELETSGRIENSGATRNDPRTQVIERTARSFGYEWTQFSRMSSHYEQNFRHYFEGYSPDFFQGKLALDAGCGSGRHSYYATKYGATVVGIDLSKAIDVAYQNNRAHRAAHFIQADLNNLPLRRELFDIVFSLGVLHHLPAPQAGFNELVKYLKPEGLMLIYVYWNLEDAPGSHRLLVKALPAVRSITTHLPHPFLKTLCFLLAAVCYIGLIIPARILKRLNRSRIAQHIPLHHYTESPFYAIFKDQFDRFSAPLAHRYSRAQILNWFTQAGFKDPLIFGQTGWRISGRKPLPRLAVESHG